MSAVQANRLLLLNMYILYSVYFGSFYTLQHKDFLAWDIVSPRYKQLSLNDPSSDEGKVSKAYRIGGMCCRELKYVA